jgi:DNA-binding beta-propeller fold protein YncE
MGARYVGSGSVWLVGWGPGAGDRRWSLVRGAARALTTRWYAALLTVVLALASVAPAAASDVYVANSGSNDVSQFDVGAGGALAPKSPATVAAGGVPAFVAVSPDGDHVYVANNGSDDVSQYDVGAGGALAPKSPATVAAGPNPFGIAVSPDGNSVYVTNALSDTVSQYDVGPGGGLSPKSPPTVDAGIGPVGIAVSPDGHRVYVANHASSTVSQYDVGAGGALSPESPATVGAGPNAFDVAVSPDGNSVYVTNQDSDTVYSDTVSQYDFFSFGGLSPKYPPLVFFPGPVAPWGIAVSTDGHSVYVALESNAVAQFDVGAGGALAPKSPATVAAGAGPIGIAVSPDGHDVYVTNANSGTVSQYDVGAGGALAPKSPATVAAGGGPSGIAVRKTTLGTPPPAPRIGDVIASVEALRLPAGIEGALLAKLTGAQRDLDANNRGGACGKLGAFINQVKAHSAKKIAAADAQALTDQATAVSESLGCGG